MPKIIAGKRVSKALTHEIEKKFLNWLAQRIPNYIVPNHFSYLAILSGVMTGVSYALVSINKAYLFLASLFIFFHWLFDSMDGTLARHRGISSEKYGYYLDHFCDMITVLSLGIGLAISGIVKPYIALLLIIAYYLVSINVFIMNYIEKEFKLSMWKIGPTEARLFIIILSIAAFFINKQFMIMNQSFTFLDIVLMPLEVIAIILTIIAFIINAHKFYKQEFPKGQRIRNPKH